MSECIVPPPPPPCDPTPTPSPNSPPTLEVISEPPVVIVSPGTGGTGGNSGGSSGGNSGENPGGNSGGNSPTPPPSSITFYGTDDSDSYVSGSGDDYLYGFDSDDSLEGGDGNDTIKGGKDDDVLYGQAGNDSLWGDSGDDVLVGGTGNDKLFGGTGNDKLFGGPGDDTLVGGRGLDVLIGGSGKDTFQFQGDTTGGDKLDKIKDFKPGDDIIELSRALLPGCRLGIGKLTAADFASVTEINETVTAKVVYEEKSGILYYNPKNGVEVPLLQLPKELSGISAENIVIF